MLGPGAAHTLHQWATQSRLRAFHWTYYQLIWTFDYLFGYWGEIKPQCLRKHPSSPFPRLNPSPIPLLPTYSLNLPCFHWELHSVYPFCEATGSAGHWGQQITISACCSLLLTPFRHAPCLFLLQHRPQCLRVSLTQPGSVPRRLQSLRGTPASGLEVPQGRNPSQLPCPEVNHLQDTSPLRGRPHLWHGAPPPPPSPAPKK